MHMMKVIPTRDMYIYEFDIFKQETQETFVVDGYTPWTIGAFVLEAKGQTGYCQDSVSRCYVIDEFLKSQGGENGEEVLIYHG